MTKPSEGIYLRKVLASECCLPDCEASAVEGIKYPICHRHAVGIYRELQALIESADVDAIEGQLAEDERRIVWAVDAVKRSQSVVYYLDFGDRVKIGYTTSLAERLVGLRANADQVLATERGGHGLENQRHAEFAHLRIGRREDFRKGPNLMEHIANLRDKHEPVITRRVGRYSRAVRRLVS